MPFLLIGALMAGIIEVFVPARWMTSFLPKHALPAILVSGLLGMVFPMCECGVVPVIRRLMKKGLPVSCAVAYLLASPVVNPIVAVSTFVAFRRPEQHPWQTTCYRLALSYLVATIVALVISRLRPEQFLNQTVLDTLPGRQKRTGGFRIGSLAGSAAAAPFSQEGTESGKRRTGGARRPGRPRRPAPDNLPAPLARRLAARRQRFPGRDGLRGRRRGPGQRVQHGGRSTRHRPTGGQCAGGRWFDDAARLQSWRCAARPTPSSRRRVFSRRSPSRRGWRFWSSGPVFDLKLIFLYSLVFKRRFVLVLGIGLFLLIGLICWKLTAINF